MHTMVYILYEELLVCAKNTSCVDLCACIIHTDIIIRIRVNFAFTYDNLFQQYGCAVLSYKKQLDIARH